MARPLRIQLAGGIYHVTSRGDGRDPIYFDDRDRSGWLQLFGDVCEHYKWECHAWCQMGNHYHFVVQTLEPNLSRGMRQLNGVYTQQVNRRYSRVGHVFQGRFKAILVEREGHLKELARYVVLNPVRAGMVSRVEQWPWSSYHAVIGTQTRPAWLRTDWVMEHFGSKPERAIENYVNFVRAGVGLPPIWKELRGQIYLGSESFMKEMLTTVSESKLDAEVPREQRISDHRTINDFRNSCRNERHAMIQAYKSRRFTMREIADAFNVHYSTVSRVVRQKRHENA